jgi:hypothetical protein
VPAADQLLAATASTVSHRHQPQASATGTGLGLDHGCSNPAWLRCSRSLSDQPLATRPPLVVAAAAASAAPCAAAELMYCCSAALITYAGTSCL